ncbi:uncharacterized protein LOC114252182 [Bombyx mandarina]|uniref:Uncharacterized protein LOC114252182 n=1 Tax=Bombyx mandarina TaxID=7092 RepID=A0A6J2KQT0_BOMMA|nr:uncharacterized protein LOC114252182 [Bombyx mandarina]
MDLKLINSLESLEKLFQTRMNDYDLKLQKASTGAVPAHVDISTLSREFNDFKAFVWQTLSQMKTQIELLSLGLDRHETMMRRKVLLLHGIPENKNEKLHKSIVEVFTRNMKLPEICIEHINNCHRLGNSQGKVRPVLVRFCSMEHRNVVWDNKTNLKGSGITVSEFLTKTRHKIFTAARQHFSVGNCWSVEGKIVILTPDKTRHKIECKSELDALTSRYPAAAAIHNSPRTNDDRETAKSQPKVTKSSRRRV